MMAKRRTDWRQRFTNGWELCAELHKEYENLHAALTPFFFPGIIRFLSMPPRIFSTERAEKKKPKAASFQRKQFLWYRRREMETVFTVKCTHPTLRLKKIDTGIKHKILLFYYARCGLFFFSRPIPNLSFHPQWVSCDEGIISEYCHIPEAATTPDYDEKKFSARGRRKFLVGRKKKVFHRKIFTHFRVSSSVETFVC